MWRSSTTGIQEDREPGGVHRPEVHLAGEQLHRGHPESGPSGLPQVSLPSGQQVRQVLADFAVCDLWRYCKALCDVKFSQI